MQCAGHRGVKNLSEGVYFNVNLTKSGCTVKIGKCVIDFLPKINLAAAPGTWGSCGVKYDPKTEERRVAIGEASPSYRHQPDERWELFFSDDILFQEFELTTRSSCSRIGSMW